MTSKEFIAKLNEADLVQKMESSKSPEEAYVIAKGYGVTDSIEAFMEEMGKLKVATGELSDDDLEAVAGGMSTSEKVTVSQAAATAAAAGA